MTTTAGAIARTRHHLMTGLPDRYNVLDLAVTDSADTVQFRYEPVSITGGTRLGIGLEELHVLSTDGVVPQSTSIVIRGFEGSTPTAHDAGTLIYVNPHFSDYRILLALNEELQDLSAAGLFRIKTATEFDYTPAQMSYEILGATDMIEPWMVRFDSPGIANPWTYLMANEYEVIRDADPGEFPSGQALVLRQGGYAGHTVRLSYKAGFSPLVTLADDVLAVTGLHTEAHRLLSLGAAITLQIGAEVKRSFFHRQGDTRRPEEVPPGASMQALRPLLQAYEDRLKREVSRLNKMYPRQT